MQRKKSLDRRRIDEYSALAIAKTALNSEAHKKLYPLSTDIARSQLQDLVKDILLHKIRDIKVSALKISMRLHESIDVDNCSQFFCFYEICKRKLNDKRISIL